MNYISTRNSAATVSGAQAIADGISPEGGLYVPCSIPVLTLQEISALNDMNYAERAAYIIGLYLPQLQNVLLELTNKAYERFNGDAAPLVKVDDGVFVLELWHGPTHAFKDMALTVLPHLLTHSKRVLDRREHTLVLVATSGDTGKAALEGFKDVDSTSIAVLYPDGGVSNLQKLQMMTQEGENVYVSAIEGNFDDAQTTVKNIFANKQFNEQLNEQGLKLSSANSINWGRLVPQIVYYFSAYADLVTGGQIAEGDKVNFTVPSGNFGNILAGYYAKQMGLPIHKLICASNRNNVLTDFFKKGLYDANRPFYKTTSPSMDILISSNLERLIFEMSGRADKVTTERMAELKTTGKYSVTEQERQKINEHFYASCASEEEVDGVIAEVFDELGYIMDPHTAVAYKVYDDYVAETGDQTVNVVVSTASPYKFVESVLKALDEKTFKNELKNLSALEEVTALPVPDSLSILPQLPKRFTDCVPKQQAAEKIMQFALKK